MALTRISNDTLQDATITQPKLGTEFTTSAVLAASNVDFSTAQVFTKTLTANDNLTFTNYTTGAVKDLLVTGDFTLGFTTGTVNTAAGTYDGTVSNLIQVICVDDSNTTPNPTFWVTISQPQV